jgi:hypothetical protein
MASVSSGALGATARHRCYGAFRDQQNGGRSNIWAKDDDMVIVEGIWWKAKHFNDFRQVDDPERASA